MQLVVSVVLLAILVVPGAGAGADPFTAVEQVYAQTQVIPPCEFSSRELNQAQSTIPNDDAQYEQDLVAAIEQARQERADGACRATRHVAAKAVTVPVGTPAPPPAAPLGRGTPLVAGSVLAATDSGPPAPFAILEIFGFLFLAATAVLCAARLRGWDPAWTARAGHLWNEAGHRVSGVWSEFGDRLRSGR